MRSFHALRLALAAATLAAPLSARAEPAMIVAPSGGASYRSTVAQVADMVSDGAVVAKVNARHLDLVNVMWEDTGRWEGSSVGPNISDVTIEVQTEGGADGRSTFLMPVIRNANFSDKTADIRTDKIFLPVGNARDTGLQTISLREFLAHPDAYLGRHGKGAIAHGSLLRKRDLDVLVSAQHAFLPVPKRGKATFYPVIFNYASSAKNPAVLTLLVTRQGTSATIIDNARDTVTGGGSWGQRLYFDKAGQRAPLIAERLADVQASGHTANGEAAASLGDDANLLMLIQIPLKHTEPTFHGSNNEAMAMDGVTLGASAGSGGAPSARRESDVDTAVLGTGPTQGPYTELDGLTIERDDRFPVRVTVQFYQATATGVASQADVDRMAKQLDRVYAAGDYVGSLVVPGPTDRQRPTAWVGASDVPAHLTLDMFPGLRERLATDGTFAVVWQIARNGQVIAPTP